MNQTTSFNTLSAEVHELTWIEWMRRFIQHLGRVRPDLSVICCLWTAAHWLDQWDVHGPEGAAQMSAGWWNVA
jgi:hypothetical protein